MTAVVVVVAAMLGLVELIRLSDGGVCVMCGGRGDHREGCPRKRP